MSDSALRDLAPPEEVRRIAGRLRDAGFEAWAVGGAVRDALAGLAPGDWDLATSARPADVQRLFRRTVPVGVEHGTVGVLGRDGRMYEVTTFRRDVETDGRRARVAFSESLEEDLGRRDFTINAVAWNPLTGEVRDPHEGMRDLAAGVLRTVGEPEERFREDRLRVLRALRFAGRFTLEVEARTWAAIRRSAHRLGGLSAERVREELLKVLSLPAPSTSLGLYERSGVLAALYPELARCVGVSGPSAPQADPDAGDVWAHLLRAVDAARPHRPVVRLAALLHDTGIPVAAGADHAAIGAAIARETMRRLKMSNADTDRVTHLVAQHASAPPADAAAPVWRRWVRVVGRDHGHDLIRLLAADARAGAGAEEIGAVARLARRMRAVARERTPLEPSELAIGGAELRTLGLPPGPLYGEILRDLLERVTDDPSLNDRDTLVRIVAERIETD